MQRMRNEIEQLQAELLFFRGDSATPLEELHVLLSIKIFLHSSIFSFLVRHVLA